MTEANEKSFEDNLNSRFKIFSLSRVIAIAMNTFTQLVRMKVFYFLLIFSVLIFWGSYVLLNKFRISLRKNIPEEGKEVESSS